MGSRHHIAAPALFLALAGAMSCAGGPEPRAEAAAPKGQAAPVELLVSEPLPPARLDPEAMRRALWEISARHRRGDAGKTLDFLQEKVDKDPSLENRFLAAAAIPDDDAAWKDLRRLLDEQPAFYWPRARIAAIYATWKVRDHCEKELARAEKAMPGNPYTRTVRGHLLRHLGDHAGAIAEYTAALQSFPADAEARTGRALSRRALGDESQLRAELERALKDVPTWYEAAETLARHADAKGQIATARATWEHVERLAPRNREAKLALARLRSDVDTAGAIQALEGAARLGALGDEEQKTLAALYRRAGRLEDERRAVEELARREPGNAGYWRRLATLREREEDWQGSQAAWRKVLALASGDADAYLGLGRAAEQQTQVRQAMEYYRQAAAAGEAAATTALDRLRAAIHLPARTVGGANLTVFYRAASDSLETAYEQRLKQTPGLRGTLRMRVVPDAEGRIAAVEAVENTLDDPWLEAHLFFVLLDGRWPTLRPQERKPFILTFDLPPTKR